MLTSSTKSTDANKKTPEKKKRLTPAEVSDIIRQKNIKTKTELYALVETQKLEGCNDLHTFDINRSSKKIIELIETTWEIEKSHRDLARQKKTCIDILRECLSANCIDGCDNTWYATAIDTLQRNKIDVQTFSRAMRVLFERGRGKYRNVLIIGPANCGKTFMLKPIKSIFETFVNPATSTFAWVGVEKAEVIFLNDFR